MRGSLVGKSGSFVVQRMCGLYASTETVPEHEKPAEDEAKSGLAERVEASKKLQASRVRSLAPCVHACQGAHLTRDCVQPTSKSARQTIARVRNAIAALKYVRATCWTCESWY